MNTAIKQHSIIARVGIVVSAVFLTAAATGEETDPGRSEPLMEEIIVTAERRAKNLQKVPIAASVYTDEFREKIGIENLQDLVDQTPGVHMVVTPNVLLSSAAISIRGIGRLVHTLGNDSSVSLYSDGFYSYEAQDLARSSAFVERTEVLRGPQGTLYGRNSIGGAVNIISKRPTDELFRELRFGYRDNERATVQGVLSGPISDRLRYRLVGSFLDQNKGYFQNVAGGGYEGGNGDNTTFDGQLEWDVTDNLELWLRITHERATTHPRGSVNVDSYNRSNGIFEQVNATAFEYEEENPAFPDNKRLFRADTQATRDSELDRAIVRAEWTTDAFDVVYVGGHSANHDVNIEDHDEVDRAGFYYLAPDSFFTQEPVPAGTPGATFISTKYISRSDKDLKYFSNEVNLVSNNDSALQWIVGGYHYHEDATLPLRAFTDSQPELINPCAGIIADGVTCDTPAAPNPDGNIIFFNGGIETDSYAAFGQIDYAFSEQLRGAVGLRYTQDEKQAKQGVRFMIFNPDLSVVVNSFGFGTIEPPGAAVDLTQFLILSRFESAPGVMVNPETGVAELSSVKDSWDGISGTAGIEWEPTDKAIYYLKYSRGYRSGGFNVPALTGPVKEEYVNAYEFGLKQDFTDRFRLNASIFYYDYENMQIIVEQCFVPSCEVVEDQFVNLTAATNFGVELESTWVVTEQFRLLASYTYLQAEINKQVLLIFNSDTEEPEDVEGNDIPWVSPRKYSATALYEVPFFDGMLTLAGNYVWAEETKDNIFGGDITSDYQKVDFWATWTRADDRYRVIGFVRNVSDEERYIYGDDDDGRFLEYVSETTPRTWGVELQIRF